MLLKVTDCSLRKPPAMSRSPQIELALWLKTPVELGKVYWRRECALDKMRTMVVCVVCKAGAFILCVDNVRS